MLRRRGFLLIGGGAGVAALAALWPRRFDGLKLDAEQAYRAATDGTLTLIDIRRPDEWALTGVGEGAHPLDMRTPDFEAALARLSGNDPTAPVALICARGVRSSRLAARLADAGFTGIIDVPEGMLGSAAGPGWIARGLPVRPG